MAKKKVPTISLQGLDDADFSQKPDFDAAESIIDSPPVEQKPKPEIKKEAPIKVKKATVKKEQKNTRRGIFPPINKKRATFNIDENLHKALKDYSYFNEIDMVEYVFEQLVKSDLKKKGYYPPKPRK